MTDSITVRCSAHVDPDLGYVHDGYTVSHEITTTQAVTLLENMSQGWSEERCCLLDALRETKPVTA